MPYIVDFQDVSTVGLESSPVAQALAGLRANEARYFRNKYDHVFTVSPAKRGAGDAQLGEPHPRRGARSRDLRSPARGHILRGGRHPEVPTSSSRANTEPASGAPGVGTVATVRTLVKDCLR